MSNPDPAGGGNRVWHAVTANFAIIATTLTLLGSSIAFFVQRHDEQKQHQEIARQEAETSKRASKKVFLDMQLAAYSETIQLVSRIANEAQNGGPVPDADMQLFQNLYVGRLALVEDRDVEASMVVFDEALQGGAECRDMLPRISLTLSHCMRKSLAESWGFDAVSPYCKPAALDKELKQLKCTSS